MIRRVPVWLRSDVCGKYWKMCVVFTKSLQDFQYLINSATPNSEKNSLQNESMKKYDNELKRATVKKYSDGQSIASRSRTKQTRRRESFIN